MRIEAFSVVSACRENNTNTQSLGHSDWMNSQTFSLMNTIIKQRIVSIFKMLSFEVLYHLPSREKQNIWIKLRLNGRQNWERWRLVVKAVTGSKRGPGHCRCLGINCCLHRQEAGMGMGQRRRVCWLSFLYYWLRKGRKGDKKQKKLWSSFENFVGEPGKAGSVERQTESGGMGVVVGEGGGKRRKRPDFITSSTWKIQWQV